MSVFALSIHATYACRHSGACCTAGWNIPIEPALLPFYRREMLVPNDRGVCEYFDEPTHLCGVHRDHGEAMLPASCRHFPRRALIDDRGVFVTLSHYCPTAASHLFDDTPLAIVANPPAFPHGRDYDGLDARGAWPPLVTASVLFDVGSYDAWERFVVGQFAQSGAASDPLRMIAAGAERIRVWKPAHGPLESWTAAALADGPRESEAVRLYEPFARLEFYSRIVDSVPSGLAKPALESGAVTRWHEDIRPSWHEWRGPVRRYLAAKAFGSWTAYQARGLRTLVAELYAADLVLSVEAARAVDAAGGPLDHARLLEAVRAADLLLMHLADRSALLAQLGAVEHAR